MIRLKINLLLFALVTPVAVGMEIPEQHKQNSQWVKKLEYYISEDKIKEVYQSINEEKKDSNRQYVLKKCDIQWIEALKEFAAFKSEELAIKQENQEVFSEDTAFDLFLFCASSATFICSMIGMFDESLKTSGGVALFSGLQAYSSFKNIESHSPPLFSKKLKNLEDLSIFLDHLKSEIKSPENEE